MVNPVTNNLTTEYQPSAGKTVKVDNEESFSLNTALNNQKQMHEGVLYEPSSERESGASSQNTATSTGTGTRGKDTFESSLDKAIKKRESENRNNSAFNESVKALWQNISSFFSSLWHNIRKVFGNVWESKPLSDGMESMAKTNAPVQSADSASDAIKEYESNEYASIDYDSKELNSNKSDPNEYDSTQYDSIEALEASRDTKIRQALSDGNRDEFRALISEDGKKIPAHNTSMLTTYDSKGKLVHINPSDENKILHGDRHTRKL